MIIKIAVNIESGYMLFVDEAGLLFWTDTDPNHPSYHSIRSHRWHPEVILGDWKKQGIDDVLKRVKFLI